MKCKKGCIPFETELTQKIKIFKKVVDFGLKFTYTTRPKHINIEKMHHVG